jgi:IS5 family transposase
VLKQARQQGLLSGEHFTVDGTLIEAWASHKSFKKKSDAAEAPPDDPGNPTVDFHGEKRCNDTHQSTTDPEARLYKKTSGSEAKLSYLGHVLMENGNGLATDACITQASGTAERDAALDMVDQVPGSHTITLGGDKNYDTKEFVGQLRAIKVTPHVAQNNSGRRSAIDERTTRHPGYEVSQRKRKRVEEIFGWLKTVAGLRKTRHRGLDRVDWMFTLGVTAYNLVRMRNLMEAAG